MGRGVHWRAKGLDGGGGLKGCRFFLFHVTKQFELKCLSLEKPGHALKQNNVFN